MDLDDWDIDIVPTNEDGRPDPGEQAYRMDFRHALLRAMSTPNTIISYRPYYFLSALVFARQDKSRNLGLFAGHQRAFEHKPWVESAITKLGIPSPGWKYIADEEQPDANILLERGPIVVRPNRGSGGQGITQVYDQKTLSAQWPKGEEFFASVSPYLPDCPSLNIGAVVWDDGVTLHYPSVQLIGIRSCVTRRFGYCGNDFALMAEMDDDIIQQLEDYTTRIANWLREKGYRGAFGVDYMLNGNELLFMEINPRFQGSTRVSCMLSVENEEPCLLIDHLAAMLHFETRIAPPLKELIRQCQPISQIVVHNTTGVQCHANIFNLSKSLRQTEPTRRMEVVVTSEIVCNIGAIATNFSVRRKVTEDGYTIDETIDKAIRETAIFY
jgi:hypothetical protein